MATMKRNVILATGAAAFLAAAGTIAGVAADRRALDVEYDEAAASSAIAIRVSIGERRLYVERAGSVVASYPVAVGKPKHETPAGSFAISRVTWNPAWVPPNSEWARGRKPRGPGDPANPMGRVKMFFRNPAYYVHGTEDASTIGRASSHGCIRMRNEDVIALAKVVMEHGGATRDGSWYRRVINRATSTEEVRLSRPVPIRIRA